MSAQLITLDQWAQAQYGPNAPAKDTLRRWCREAKIFPIPRKHGRSYFLDPNARYVGEPNSPGFIEAIRESTQTQ